MTPRPKHPPTVDDFATALFRQRRQDLHNLVRSRVHAPEAVIEDACSFAWMQFVRCEPRHDTAYLWLIRVAIREAWKLAARERRDARLEDLADDAAARHAPHDTELAMSARHALEAVADLPERQRTYLVLVLNGTSYDDVADRTQTSRSAVNKHLARARKTLRQRRHL